MRNDKIRRLSNMLFKAYLVILNERITYYISL